MKKNKEKKNNRKFVSFKLLQKEVESYGYHYSFKSFLIHMMLSLSFVVIVSLFAKLHWSAIALMGIITLFLMPFMIKAQFTQLHHIDRFEMVTNYLNNILPVFKQTPKILTAMENVVDMLSGEMRERVSEAINYIKTNMDDTDIYTSAFKIIEDAFPNSRIHSLHTAMITIENENSNNYYKTIDNIYYDIQEWISRTYGYQKDLKKTKRDLLILCIITLCMSMLFVFIYGSTEYFAGYTDMIGYQIVTSIFMIIMMSIICMMQIKLNGQWLVDDRTDKNSKRAVAAYDYIKSYQSKTPMPIIVLSAIFIIAGVCMLFMQQYLLATVAIVFALMFVYYRSFNYKTKRKVVLNTLKIEFPIWLRDIALNLHNYVVVNAIENSVSSSSGIMQEFLQKFLDAHSQSPTSIQPYNEFFEGYDYPEAQSALRILYSVQKMNEAETDNQINSLIKRNQELLGKSEEMRNEESLTGLTVLGFVPVLMTLFLMVGNMALLFVYMMSMLSEMVVM